jgi:hypothetical protein
MIPVRKTDVALGKPLPYSLFDSNNKLLLKAGVIVQTQNQLDVLSERGLYRDHVATSLPSVTARAGQEGETKRESEKNGVNSISRRFACRSATSFNCRRPARMRSDTP